MAYIFAYVIFLLYLCSEIVDYSLKYSLNNSLKTDGPTGQTGNNMYGNSNLTHHLWCSNLRIVVHEI